MILAVDSSALALLINPAANPPHDPQTDLPVQDAQARVEHFLSSLRASDTLVIPTPVLAEILVRADEGGPGVLEKLVGMARVKVRPFGERAAIETAVMTRQAIATGDKKNGSDAAWQKVKIDRQVIAVARAEGATALYTDDRNLIAFAKRIDMDVVSTWTLPLPESEANLFTLIGLDQNGRRPQSAALGRLGPRAINLELDDGAEEPRMA